MTRRFWIGAALAVPMVVLEMGAHIPALNLHHYISPRLSMWVQFVLATPVVLWAGWPFFERGWASVRNRSLNMFSLIALGRRRGLSLQPRRDLRARHSFRQVCGRMAESSRSITKRPPSSRCSFCLARYSNCARASRPAAPFARC